MHFNMNGIFVRSKHGVRNVIRGGGGKGGILKIYIGRRIVFEELKKRVYGVT